MVLGRETSPVPVQTHTRIPQEIGDKFAGMTREVRVVSDGYPGYTVVAGPYRDGGEAPGAGGGPGEEDGGYGGVY